LRPDYGFESLDTRKQQRETARILKDKAVNLKFTSNKMIPI
jgi:hypothetical protein